MSTPNPYIADGEPAGDAVPQGRRRRPWLPGLPKSVLGRALAFIVAGSVAVVGLMFVSVEFFGREDGFRDEEERATLFVKTRCVEYVELFADGDLGDVAFFSSGNLAPVTLTGGDRYRLGHILAIGGRVAQDQQRTEEERTAGVVAMHRVLHLVDDAAMLEEGSPGMETVTLDLGDPQYKIEPEPETVDGCRDSWLWRYTKHYALGSPGYGRFTYDDAIRAGVAK